MTVGGRVASRLKELRAQKGWTQERAAKEIGVQEVTLWRLEHGRHQPQHNTLLKIAYAYKVHPAGLLLDALIDKEAVCGT